MASGVLQGWHPDPFGVHELRYFSVGRPTMLVRDGRIEAYDEPPHDSSGSNSSPEPDAAVGAAAVSAPAVSAAQRATADATLPAVRPSGQDLAEATHILTASPADTAAMTTRDGRGPVAPPRRRWEYAAVAAGAVVAVIVFVLLGGGGSGSPGVAPAAFVTKAAQRTLAQSTADVTLSGTATVDGQTLAMGGNGQVDLAHNVMSFNLGATMSGGSITEAQLEVGGNLYFQVVVNGHGLTLSGGRHWIEAPVAQSGGRSLITGSPASSLALLSQRGSRVTTLGTRSIGGRTCNGYTVTPNRQAMVVAARLEFARLGFSAADQTTALQAVQGLTPPTITAWFDAKHQLACQVSVYMRFGTPTSAGSGGVAAVVTFTHYGVPVKVTPPAASDTVSLQQFLTTAHP